MASTDDGRASGKLRGLPLVETFAIPAFRFYWLSTLAFFLVFGAQRFIFVWLVLELTGRPGLAGVTGFALGIPAFFLTLPAGVMADRVHRGRVVVVSMLSGSAIMWAAALLVRVGMMDVPAALLIALAVGVVGAVTQPALMAIVPAIVPRERLMNGIALRTISQNIGMIFGAGAGGLAIHLWGFAGAFTLQAIAYALAAAAVLPVRLPSNAAAGSGEPARLLPQLREGLRFVFGDPGLRALVVLMMFSGVFMLGAAFVLLPEVGRSRLDQGAATTGQLFSITGVGMLAVSIWLATRDRVGRRGLGYIVTMLVFGALPLIGMGLSTSYPLTALVMLVWGFGGGLFINLNQSLLQEQTPDEMMGRVMSISALSIAGLIPLGSLLAGAAGDLIGASRYLVLCGLVLAVAAVGAILTQPRLRAMD